MRIERFAVGLTLPETPRWHDGSLWISDMWDHTVLRFDATGHREVVHRFPDDEDPGGLGWLPDGDLLVVGMEGRVLYRLGTDGVLRVHADLAPWAPWQCNDLITRADGVAYVSHFGFDMWGGSTGFRAASLLRVQPDGEVDVVADQLLSPNGMALDASDAVLYLAECGRSAVVAFGVREDGTLGARRDHAVLPAAPGQSLAPPDGICLDQRGGVWAAEPLGRRVVRVDASGTLTDEIVFDVSPLAVVLGGDDRRTLFVCVSAEHHKPTRGPIATGRVDIVRVDVPGIGVP